MNAKPTSLEHASDAAQAVYAATAGVVLVAALVFYGAASWAAAFWREVEEWMQEEFSERED